MSLFAFASAKGSPGVTTTVVTVAATWPAGRRVLIAELDVAGGDLAARLDLEPDPGLVTFAASSHDRPVVSAHAQQLGDDVYVLVAPVRGQQVRSCVRALGKVAEWLAVAEGDVLVDCGRAEPGTPVFELADTAACVVLVCGSRPEDVGHALGTVADLRDAGANLGLIVVGDRDRRPARGDEVAEVVGLPLLGELPHDRRAAALVNEGWRRTRALQRSRLLRSAAAVAVRLNALTDVEPLMASHTELAMAEEHLR